MMQSRIHLRVDDGNPHDKGHHTPIGMPEDVLARAYIRE
jgi:hypothetical protein